MKNKKKIFVAYNLMILILTIIFIVLPSIVIKVDSIKIDNQKPLEPFNDETVIEQRFISDDNYDSFAVFFATYNYIFKNGNITIDLLETGSNKHCKRNIYATSLTDTGPTTIECELKKNKEYSLKINTRGIPNYHKITLYTTSYDDDNYELLVDDTIQEENLVIYYYKNVPSYTNLFYIFLLITIDIIVYPSVFLSRKRDVTYEK